MLLEAPSFGKLRAEGAITRVVPRMIRPCNLRGVFLFFLNLSMEVSEMMKASEIRSKWLRFF